MGTKTLRWNSQAVGGAEEQARMDTVEERGQRVAGNDIKKMACSRVGQALEM